MTSGSHKPLLLMATFIALIAAGCGPSSSETNSATDTTAGDVLAAEVTYEYEDTNDCFADGYPLFLYAADPESSMGWVDLDSNGTVDVIRADSDVYFRADSLEGFPADATWIEVPGNASEDENQFARFTALSPVSFGLLDAVSEPFVVEDLEGRENPSHLQSDDPDSPLVAWSEDADGEIEELTVTPQHPTPTGHLEVTYTRAEAPGVPEVPDESETVSFADVPAKTAILSSSVYGPACSELSAAEVEQQRECVADVAGDFTVGEWLDETDPAEWQPVLACP